MTRRESDCEGDAGAGSQDGATLVHAVHPQARVVNRWASTPSNHPEKMHSFPPLLPTTHLQGVHQLVHRGHVRVVRLERLQPLQRPVHLRTKNEAQTTITCRAP